MMKILLINTLYYPNVIGGAERSVQFLAEALTRKGHETVVVSASYNCGVQISEVNGVKVYYVGLKNLYWPFSQKHNSSLIKPLWHLLDTYNPLMASEVDRILAIEKPDVVHTNNLSCFSVAIWKIVKARKLPLVHTIRDYYLLCPKPGMFSRGRNCEKQCMICRLYSVIRHKYSKLVYDVVGISRFVLEKHTSLGFFPHARCEVIFNAYENKTFSFQASENRQPSIRFGYIGRLHYTKGVEIILEAVRMLPEGTWTLSIAGQGSPEYEKHLKINNLDNTYFMGFVRPEEFFPLINVLIVPSLWHEPLGRTVFEAYSHGVPVIGSRRGGIPELIEEGKTGFLFDPEYSEELARVMNKFIQKPKIIDAMLKNCHEKAQEFVPGRIAELYIQVYENAMMQNRRISLPGVAK